VIVLYPTDTIYGLGVVATDPEAVLQLIALKGRPAFAEASAGKRIRPISIVVSDMEMAREYAEVTPLAKMLAETFLPGKLTLVLNAKDNLPVQLTGGTGTIGIRIPNHPVPLQLVRDLGKPITATSANVADLPTLKTPKEILAQFGERAGMITKIIDEGALPESLPSTVVDARGERVAVLRAGAVSEQDLVSSFDSI
jgi:L-threonylcarbamoyladenylate synthase